MTILNKTNPVLLTISLDKISIILYPDKLSSLIVRLLRIKTSTMATSTTNKKKKELAPGILIECKSGRYVAFYEHRTDIIANGESEKEAKKNLKKLYAGVIKEESEEREKKEKEQKALTLPATYKIKNFTESVVYP